jgi:hypothetical protein
VRYRPADVHLLQGFVSRPQLRRNLALSRQSSRHDHTALEWEKDNSDYSPTGDASCLRLWSPRLLPDMLLLSSHLLDVTPPVRIRLGGGCTKILNHVGLLLLLERAGQWRGVHFYLHLVNRPRIFAYELGIRPQQVRVDRRSFAGSFNCLACRSCALPLGARFCLEELELSRSLAALRR